MIFSLAIQSIILSLDSQEDIWNLDNGSLADYLEVVWSDFKKFNFLLRTTPFWKFSNYVNSIDSSLLLLNLRLTDLQWCQSSLPIRFGGLGIRRISDICLFLCY
jgi:hypothetical protein